MFDTLLACYSLRYFLSCCFCLFFLLWSQTAQAYLPPAEQIIRIMLESRRNWSIKDISCKLTGTYKQGQEEGQTFSERLYLQQGEKARQLSFQKDGNYLSIVHEEQYYGGLDTDKKLQIIPPQHILTHLLFPKGKDIEEMSHRILEILEHRGIHTAVVSMKRFQENVVYVIGAKPWEEKVSQIWFYKNNFLPAFYRYLAFDKDGKTASLFESQFLNYGQVSATPFLPKIIESNWDDKLVKRSEMVQVQLNPHLPDTLFQWSPLP